MASPGETQRAVLAERTEKEGEEEIRTSSLPEETECVDCV